MDTKTILVQPIRNCASESKLALICKHRGWKLVESGPADLKVWLSDDPQLDLSFINYRVLKITKQLVNDIFDFVFRYPVEADPEKHECPCVKKRLDHGTHGVVVKYPVTRERGFCYQKLLTNNPSEKYAVEYRIDVYGSRMLNTEKHLEKGPSGMPLASRQNNSFNFNCGLEMFDAEERQKLLLFCHYIGCEFGSLDVIRHLDGSIYIIDCTTNTGVPTISWHKNADLKYYLEISAQYFEEGLLS